MLQTGKPLLSSVLLKAPHRAPNSGPLALKMPRGYKTELAVGMEIRRSSASSPAIPAGMSGRSRPDGMQNCIVFVIGFVELNSDCL
jgi:hypothetical protein